MENKWNIILFIDSIILLGILITTFFISNNLITFLLRFFLIIQIVISMILFYTKIKNRKK